MAVDAGRPFPSYASQTQDGEFLSLNDYRGGQNLVVFFYPKATTSGCVRETTEFSARRHEFDALGTKIVGISVDDPALQKQHAIQCTSNVPLLCDTEKKLTTSLGILNEERGMAKRTTYVLDKSGTVRKVFNNVSVDGHVDEVLQAVKELQA